MFEFLHNLGKRTSYPDRTPGSFHGMPRVFVLSILLFLVALFFRSWQNILHPGLYMEDAPHYFNIYYGLDRGLSFILQHPNGYYNIFNNLVAWLASRIDVRLQPLTYHSVALLVGITTAVCFLFTGLIRTRSMVLITPLVLGLSGMNHIYYFNTLTFQMYNVVVLLLCLLFFPAPRNRLVLVLQCLLATLLVWSGPYSVVALPVSILLLLLFKNRGRRIFLVTVIINVALYSLSVRESTIRLYNIADEGLRRIAAQVLFERIFFLDLLGSLSTVKIGLFFLVLAGFFFYLRSDAFYLKISALFFAIIIGSLAPLFLSVKFLLYKTIFPCHVYISQFFWLCFLLFTADRMIERLRPRAVFQVLIVAFFLFGVTVDNISHPAKGKRDLMPAIPAFVQTIHLIEQLELEKKNEYVVLKTDNVIPLHLPVMVRVGSQRLDARRLTRRELSIPAGKHFIVD